MLRKVRRFLQVNGNEKLLFLEALLLSFGAFIAIRFLPMRWYAARTIQAVDHEVSPAGASASPLSRRVTLAVRRAGRVAPWRVMCFEKALTAKWMLGRLGCSSTLYLGLAKKGEQLKAHAWLHDGDKVITGGLQAKEFNVLASFR